MLGSHQPSPSISPGLPACSKTTLADRLLHQALMLSQPADGSGGEQQGSITQSLDHNELERERGITILSKVTSFMYKVTPGQQGSRAGMAASG